MSREIPLTQGKVALVDDEDYPLVAQFKWHAELKHRSWYAVTVVSHPRQHNVRMHRLIAGTPKGELVDHKNNDGLDNRRQNLRPCSFQQNNSNRRPNKRSATGFKGIYRARARWQANISVNNRTVHLGGFTTPEEAARAYDAAAIDHYGEFAYLNFPEASQ